MSTKLDLFGLLDQINKKNVQYFKCMTDEDVKAFQPLVVMRWLSGTASERQIVYLNELVNPCVFSLYKHKELLYGLLTTCTSGKSQRYVWNKTVSKKTTMFINTVEMIKSYYKYDTLRAIDALPLLSDQDILMMADDLGLQKEEISKIKKELKARNES